MSAEAPRHIGLDLPPRDAQAAFAWFDARADAILRALSGDGTTPVVLEWEADRACFDSDRGREWPAGQRIRSHRLGALGVLPSYGWARDFTFLESFTLTVVRHEGDRTRILATVILRSDHLAVPPGPGGFCAERFEATPAELEALVAILRRLSSANTPLPMETSMPHTRLLSLAALPLALALAVAPAGAKDGVDRHGDPLPAGAAARCGTTRGLVGYSYRAAFTPDGRLGALAQGKEVQLFDATTGKDGPRLVGHGGDGDIMSVALSADGRLVASGGWDRTLRIWDAATGKETRKIEGFVGPVWAIAFSPDGKTLATTESLSSDQTRSEKETKRSARLRFFAVADGRDVGQATGEHALANYLAFSPDGKRLLANRNEQGEDEAALWDVPSAKVLRVIDVDRPDDAGTAAVAFAPGGGALAIGTIDGAIRVLDGAGAKETARLDAAGATEILGMAFSPDGKRLAYVSDGIYLWDVGGKEARRLYGSESDTAWAVAFAPDGGTLVAVVGGWLKRVDLATGRAQERAGHGLAVRSVAFAPDGRTLATGSDDGTVRLWDASSGQETLRIRPIAGEATAGVAFAGPDGKALLTWAGYWTGVDAFRADATVRVRDPETGAEVRRLEGADGVYSVSMTRDGRLAAVGGPKGVHLYEVASGKLVRKAGREGESANTVLFSPDGATIAFATTRSDDSGESFYAVRLLDVASGKERQGMEGLEDGIHALAFSPDGASLVAGGMGGTAVYDVATAKVRVKTEHYGAFPAVAFAPDGKTFAIGMNDVVFLHDAATAKEIGRLEGHTRQVTAVAYAPDGKTLASGSEDGTALIWRIPGAK